MSSTILIAINKDQYGKRKIEYLNYDSEDTPADLIRVSKFFKQDYDEVYLLPLNTDDEDMIDTIITLGEKL